MYMRKIRARALWNHMINSQLETGTPYVMFKDHVNRKSNQSNVGVVRSSNLCSEICEVSNADTYAVCNLASIAVNRFYDPIAKTFDHARLHETAKQLTYNLNRVIDINTYPTPECRASNMSMRPIGVGVQGLADLYCMLGLAYDDPRAVALDAEVMETIYHGCVEASVELAERDGPYERFEGSPASKGLLQFDLWKRDAEAEAVEGGVEEGVGPLKWEWRSLKDRVRGSGMRNSLLTALMPTATTSQIMGNNESFEPFQGNVFKRSTLAGEFMVINRHLMKELMEAGLWSEEMRKQLLAGDGSVQGIEAIPERLKLVYRTVWEVSQRVAIDHAAARGPFVDQSQSMNLYMAAPSFQKLSSALMYAWKRGLKTGVYYLRSMAAVEATKYGGGAAYVSGGPAPPLRKALLQEKEKTEAAGAGAEAAADGDADSKGGAAEGGAVCKRRKPGDDGPCEMCSA
jgi:ribonucleoside-diphosphate reductase alpha subunit